jgi:hypothetical protein
MFAPTPFLSGIILDDGKDTPLVDKTLYRHLVGILLYQEDKPHQEKDERFNMEE